MLARCTLLMLLHAGLLPSTSALKSACTALVWPACIALLHAPLDNAVLQVSQECSLSRASWYPTSGKHSADHLRGSDLSLLLDQGVGTVPLLADMSQAAMLAHGVTIGNCPQALCAQYALICPLGGLSKVPVS